MYSKDGSVFDRRELLKIKLKSLAAEARIIRQTELGQRSKAAQIRKGVVKYKDGKEIKRIPPREPSVQLRHEMWLHRIGPLRTESRLTHIAYGLIRGRTIEDMEGKKHQPYNEARVTAMLIKYGSAEIAKAAKDSIPADPGTVKQALAA